MNRTHQSRALRVATAVFAVLITSVTASGQLADTPWPTMNRDLQRTGRSPYIGPDEPVKKWRRLAPGVEVRLRGGYFVTCDEVVKDDAGEVVELRCSHDPATRGGAAPDGRKVKGTIHWVSAAHAVDATCRLYDRLFSVEDPMDVPERADLSHHLNPDSLEVRAGCKLEPSLAGAEAGTQVQFERLGYFIVDADTAPDALIFNRTIALRDSWAKTQKPKGK